MLMNKRGISPLIATLLLISFAVAVGVVIMNFSKAEVEAQAECPIDVNLRFAVINGVEQICYDQNKGEFSFVIENGINTDISGIVVNIIGTEKAETYESDEALIRAASFVKKISYTSEISGMIRQVKISPKVELQGEIFICPEKSLIAESIPDC